MDVRKATTKRNLGRNGFILSYIYCPSWRKDRANTQGRKLKVGTDPQTVKKLCLPVCSPGSRSTTCLIPSRTSYAQTAQPMVVWDLLHQLIKCLTGLVDGSYFLCCCCFENICLSEIKLPLFLISFYSFSSLYVSLQPSNITLLSSW